MTPKGNIVLNFPNLDPDELEHTCALDVADLGGCTLADAGRLLNITRERIRQIEAKALSSLQRSSKCQELRSPDANDRSSWGAHGQRSIFEIEPEPSPDMETDEESEDGTLPEDAPHTPATIDAYGVVHSGTGEIAVADTLGEKPDDGPAVVSCLQTQAEQEKITMKSCSVPGCSATVRKPKSGITPPGADPTKCLVHRCAEMGLSKDQYIDRINKIRDASSPESQRILERKSIPCSVEGCQRTIRGAKSGLVPPGADMTMCIAHRCERLGLTVGQYMAWITKKTKGKGRSKASGSVKSHAPSRPTYEGKRGPHSVAVKATADPSGLLRDRVERARLRADATARIARIAHELRPEDRTDAIVCALVQLETETSA
jgi:hypothetical protein